MRPEDEINSPYYGIPRHALLDHIEDAHKRIEELEAPFKHCDEHDWDWLFRLVPDEHPERTRFWHNRLREFRKALGGGL